jgi:hypothetical protein
MRSGPGGALLAASLAFAGAASLGSAVAVRDQLPGQPLGISIPMSVPAGLLAGWGPVLPRRGRCPWRRSSWQHVPSGQPQVRSPAPSTRG